MNTKLGLILALVTVAALSGCSKEIEISGADGGFSIPTGQTTTRTALEEKTFEGTFGQIRFAQAEAGRVQVFRTCSFNASYCDSMGTPITATFDIALNNANSYYQFTRANGSKATIHATGSLSSLVLTTTLSSSNRIVETFTVVADPCEENRGKGLQVLRESIQSVSGGEISTETCNSYR